MWIVILVAYQLTNTIVFGSIFNPIRRFFKRIMGDGDTSLHKLMSCMLCMGTWVGFLVTILLISTNLTPLLPTEPYQHIINNNPYALILLNTFLLAGTTWLIHTIQEMLERIGNGE